MGEVYRAHDERLGRDIALKILSGDLAESSDHLHRFEQEARAASALNHPNIITIYDIGRIDDVAYIAMELIEGRDVRSLLAGEPLPLKHALRVAVKVADGLAAAHERGIVHRDLKPANVKMTDEGVVKVLDFGLAKVIEPPGAPSTDAANSPITSSRGEETSMTWKAVVRSAMATARSGSRPTTRHAPSSSRTTSCSPAARTQASPFRHSLSRLSACCIRSWALSPHFFYCVSFTGFPKDRVRSRQN